MTISPGAADAGSLTVPLRVASAPTMPARNQRVSFGAAWARPSTPGTGRRRPARHGRAPAVRKPQQPQHAELRALRGALAETSSWPRMLFTSTPANGTYDKDVAAKRGRPRNSGARP